ARCGPVAVAHRFAPLVPDRLVSSRRRAAAVSAGPDPGPGGAGPSGAGTSGHRGGPFGRTRIESGTLAGAGPSGRPGRWVAERYPLTSVAEHPDGTFTIELP